MELLTAPASQTCRKVVLLALTLALGASCGASDAPAHSIFGGWTGTTVRTGTRYSTGGMSWADNVPATAWVWNIRQCSSGAMVEVALNCWLPASSTTTDLLTFVPDAWCEASSLGKTTRITAKGGSVRLATVPKGQELRGEYTLQTEKVPTDGTYTVQTWSVKAAEFVEGEKLACPQANSGDIAPVDYSALAKCTTILDRHYPSNDCSVALTSAGFDPQCLLIAVGQSVTFTGDFAKYGLRPGIFGDLAAGAPANPLGIILAGASTVVTYPKAGDFLFHSPTGAHPAGMIRVR